MVLLQLYQMLQFYFILICWSLTVVQWEVCMMVDEVVTDNHCVIFCVRVTTMLTIFASAVSFCVRSWTRCSMQLINARPSLLTTRHSCSSSGKRMLWRAGLVSLMVLCIIPMCYCLFVPLIHTSVMLYAFFNDCWKQLLSCETSYNLVTAECVFYYYFCILIIVSCCHITIWKLVLISVYTVYICNVIRI